MKIEENKSNSISFTGFGVYGLGYDSWFKSKIYFNIDLKKELVPYEIESFPGRKFFENAGT